MEKEAGGSPPLSMPINVKQELTVPNHSIISRRGFGSSGRSISLLANHFKVSVNAKDAVFYQYSVSITSEDNRAVEGKGIGRKIIDKLYQTYSSELAGKRIAYDGEKSLYTVGPLLQNRLEFTVVLEGSFAKCEVGSPGNGGSPAASSKRSKRSFQSKTFKVEISYAAKIPLKSIALAFKGVESEHNNQDALRVLDIILRQQAANRGCLLVRQSFFLDDPKNFTDVGGGVTGVRGFHSSFRTTQGGLSLNMDVSTTMILTPGPVIDFLKANQNVQEPRYIDWVKAKRMLKNLRVRHELRKMEFKIIGLSEKPCNQQYFVHLFLCNVIQKLYLQCKEHHWLKNLDKAFDRMRTVTDALINYHYDDDSVLSACGVSIEKQLMQLKVGNSEDCFPRNGRWNFNNKTLWKSTSIERWAVVNFSARCDTSQISRDLINCGRRKGIQIGRPYTLIEEDPQSRRGPWKKKCLSDFGIVTQCISPFKINDQYLTNVLLKINSKLGGINSLLAIEDSRHIPLIKDTPTIILGMDVSHGSPGRSDIPSVAAVMLIFVKI
ncbi:hypothetical protein GH714_031781 [Hevea brasiliensis]|uniref:Piwi domain-containing protein n=1 Tax=Hevea brasiliensis TaxID=3981 RepID=A0A6A6K9S6_HEVBR|nr:hypothetical protein GH714_031781 [Hevea brasiliensis]